MNHPSIQEALARGRRAAEILESTPIDGHGFTDDEVAAQYAATDRLLAVFRQLEEAIEKFDTPREGEP